MSRIDHFFAFCAIAAPERQQLLAAGLEIGAQRHHTGQGTSNLCFGFADSYLELIWLDDEEGARSAMVKPLGLQERADWRKTGASPFGVCLRPQAADEPPPFAHWDYRPPYLPDDARIAMACNSGVIGEPLLFQIDRDFESFGVAHDFAAATLASLVVTSPGLAPMSLLHEVEVDGLTLRSGDAHLMEVTLSRGDRRTDGDPPGQLDMRPELPLVLRW